MAKIVIIGCGGIGLECIFEAQQRGHEVVVLSRNAESAYEKYLAAFKAYNREVVEGIRQGDDRDPLTFWEFAPRPVDRTIDTSLSEEAFTEDYSAISDADYIISTAAKSVIDKNALNRNIFLESGTISAEVAKNIKPHLKENAVVLTPVNPVELQTSIYQNILDAHQVIGIGTAVDTTRMEFVLRHFVENYSREGNPYTQFQGQDFRIIAPVFGLHRNDGHIFTEPRIVFNGNAQKLPIDKRVLDAFQEIVGKYGWEVREEKRREGKGEWDCHGPAAACLRHIDAQESDSTRNLVVSMNLSSAEIAKYFSLEESAVHEVTGGGPQVLGVPVTISKHGMDIDQGTLKRADTRRIMDILGTNQETLNAGYNILTLESTFMLSTNVLEDDFLQQ